MLGIFSNHIESVRALEKTFWAEDFCPTQFILAYFSARLVQICSALLIRAFTCADCYAILMLLLMTL